MNGPYVLGIDLGTGGCRVGIFDLTGEPVNFCDTPVKTTYPHPGWAEQDPREWWSALVTSTRKVVRESGVGADEIIGIGYDATSATPVALDADGEPLRQAILWMDVRSVEQARRADASSHEARRYNGYGAASAEWFPFKVAWLRENEPEIFAKTAMLLDCPDWIGYKLTGIAKMNLCSASMKGYHDNDLNGLPHDFYEEVGAGDAIAKMPSDFVPMGDYLGPLDPKVAEILGLKAGTPVGVGGIDAEAGMIGMNVLQPGKAALITGTSDCLLAQCAEPVFIKGMFGAYTDSVVQGQYTIEASQPSTGSAMRWFRDNFAQDLAAKSAETGKSIFDLLNDESRHVPIGSDGVLVNEYFQGNRCPYTDSTARATFTGLSLSHTRAHLYRANQEAACYGLEHNLRILKDNGFSLDRIFACGGSVSSKEWMQMHADVTGIPITITKVQDGPTLGSAMIGAVAAKYFETLQDAANVMVHESHTFEPNQDAYDEYRFYVDQYIDLYPAVRPIQQKLTARREAK